MISDLVLSKLNITANKRQLERLSHLRMGHYETDIKQREFEMENVWLLLQENEYLISIIYENYDLFPHFIGTCGTFFAVEYVYPIENPTTLLALSDDVNEWSKRLKLAIKIINYIDEIESNKIEKFYLCDVKINHFGTPVGDDTKLKFLDLDSVFPESIISRILSDNKDCDKHEDCDYFDCRSVCSVNKRCESPVMNDNLQVFITIIIVKILI